MQAVRPSTRSTVTDFILFYFIFPEDCITKKESEAVVLTYSWCLRSKQSIAIGFSIPVTLPAQGTHIEGNDLGPCMVPLSG